MKAGLFCTPDRKGRRQEGAGSPRLDCLRGVGLSQGGGAPREAATTREAGPVPQGLTDDTGDLGLPSRSRAGSPGGSEQSLGSRPWSQRARPPWEGNWISEGKPGSRGASGGVWCLVPGRGGAGGDPGVVS